MRLSSFFSGALILCIAATAFGQEYVEYKSQQDRVGIVFPAQPKVSETTYETEFHSVLPARVYSVDAGQSHFSVTVVDFNDIQAIATEKAKACPKGAETCLGGLAPTSSTGAGYWKADLAGAVMNATWRLMERDAKVTYVGWTNIDLVEGNMVSLTNNKDKSRTSAAVFMHANKLYVLEGTVPAGYPVPDFFQQSVQWLDENGTPIRYSTLYHNGFPAPPINGRNPGQPGGAAGGRGAQQTGQPR